VRIIRNHGENILNLSSRTRFGFHLRVCANGCRMTTWFISCPNVVDQLNLSAIESVYEEDDRGQPPYHPRMMTKILLYGYCVGVFSSRKIQKHLVEDVAFRMLAAGNQPDFRTISDFRKLHLKALEELFQQMLQLTLETGTMKLGRVALSFAACVTC
jgi:hypothetical protein